MPNDTKNNLVQNENDKIQIFFYEKYLKPNFKLVIFFLTHLRNSSVKIFYFKYIFKW